jgi:hypothetical protein
MRKHLLLILNATVFPFMIPEKIFISYYVLLSNYYT